MVKFILVSSLVLSASVALARVGAAKVVYGEDDRLDVVQVKNKLHAQLSLSTAAMVLSSDIKTSGNSCSLDFNETLETRMNVCPTERFSQQAVGALCSGFLVGSDILVTAGHCLKSLAQMGYSTPESVCRAFSWVFNYDIDRAGRNPLTGLTRADVYKCKSVINATLTNSQDFAVIKLDRKVTGRQPLKFRTTGKIASGATLVVIGHPSGLPTKVAAGARVLQNSTRTTFGASLDTFHGNSGSAVFDAKTGLLEGILVQGKTDYRPNLSGNPRSCKVLNICSQNGTNCSANISGDLPFEVVTRITLVAPFIRAQTAKR